MAAVCVSISYIYLDVILQRIYIPRMLSLLNKTRWNSTLVGDSSFLLTLSSNEIEKRIENWTSNTKHTYVMGTKITQKQKKNFNNWKCMMYI